MTNDREHETGNLSFLSQLAKHHLVITK